MIQDIENELLKLSFEENDGTVSEQFHEGYICGINQALAIILERSDMYEKRLI